MHKPKDAPATCDVLPDPRPTPEDHSVNDQGIDAEAHKSAGDHYYKAKDYANAIREYTTGRVAPPTACLAIVPYVCAPS